MSDTKIERTVRPQTPNGTRPNGTVFSKLLKLFGCISLILFLLFIGINYIVHFLGPKPPKPDFEELYKEEKLRKEELEDKNDKLEEDKKNLESQLNSCLIKMNICEEEIKKLEKKFSKTDKLTIIGLFINSIDTVLDEDKIKLFNNIFKSADKDINDAKQQEIINYIESYNQFAKDKHTKDEVEEYKKKTINKICEKHDHDQMIEFLCQSYSAQSLPK